MNRKIQTMIKCNLHGSKWFAGNPCNSCGLNICSVQTVNNWKKLHNYLYHSTGVYGDGLISGIYLCRHQWNVNTRCKDPKQGQRPSAGISTWYLDINRFHIPRTRHRLSSPHFTCKSVLVHIATFHLIFCPATWCTVLICIHVHCDFEPDEML